MPNARIRTREQLGRRIGEHAVVIKMRGSFAAETLPGLFSLNRLLVAPRELTQNWHRYGDFWVHG